MPEITMPKLSDTMTEGTIVATLSYEHVRQPHPVFHGDTIYVESEVLEKRESRSRPDRGLVRLRHTGRNQDGTTVLDVERTVMFLKRDLAAGEQGPAHETEQIAGDQ